jgi:hypothetical protein
VVSPEIFGRNDIDKFTLALAECDNWIVSPLGPVKNRAGLRFVCQSGNITKTAALIPFTFNSSQTFVLEFGHQYVRFHTLGATLVETAKNITGITFSNPGVLTVSAHGYTAGQMVFVSGLTAGPTELNGQFYLVGTPSTDEFELLDLRGVAVNASALPAYVSGGTVSRVYSVSTPYDADHVKSLHYSQSGDILTLAHPLYDLRELRRVSATNWTLTTITFAPGVSAPTGVAVVATTGTGTTTYEYVVTAHTPDYLEESVASATVSCTNNLTTAGNKNTVSWSASSGATRYSVYKKRNGVFGYIGQTTSLSFVDDNIDPDLVTTPPENSTPFTGADNRPGAVAHADQRRLFAGTNNKPQNVWATRTGTESNLAESVPARDTDAMRFRIAREQNRINHLVALSDLLALTYGNEHLISPTDGGALTPASIGVKKQDEFGAADAQPVVIGNVCLYLQAGATKVREIAYSDENKSYITTDATLLADHLLGPGKVGVQMAMQKLPIPILWVVREDGTLLGMTYVRGQNVAAWHTHSTDGFFESVACVREGNVDGVYVLVRRTVNGQTVRYIERLDDRDVSTLEDCFFLDAGVTYSGSAATVITGLRHLEGLSVKALADGSVVGPFTVTGGRITLPVAAQKVQVGLPYQADLETLPVALGSPDAGMSQLKAPDRVYLRVRDSSGLDAGPSFDYLRPFPPDSSSLPPVLQTRTIELPIDSVYELDARICVRQTDPLPCTLLSLGAEIAIPD